MKFLDQAKIFAKSGNGGDGCVSFRRERFVEMGGPDGGNGGNGGDILFQVSKSLNTLIDYRYKQHFKAPKGGGGKGRQRNGEKGRSVCIKVPPGTQIWDEQKKILLKDFTDPGNDEWLFLEGGKGGLGNTHFKTSVRQAPKFSQKGAEGEEAWVWLRLKLIADIGLVGLPNAGKSSLLRALTNAKPKVANYPFTTIHPNLGALENYEKSLVIADIPGLIEGAHTGKGIGDRFLGHVERCSMLVHVVDISEDSFLENMAIIEKEMTLYSKTLSEKKLFYVFNKADLLEKDTLEDRVAEAEKVLITPSTLVCSTTSGTGIKDLSDLLFQFFSNKKENLL